MQKELNKLYELVRDLADLYDDKMLVTASVLIQNMAFRSDIYSEREFNKYLNILRKMADYRKDSHILQWVYQDASMQVYNKFLEEHVETGYHEFESSNSEN